jgi:hypothetical protein
MSSFALAQYTTGIRVSLQTPLSTIPTPMRLTLRTGRPLISNHSLQLASRRKNHIIPLRLVG